MATKAKFQFDKDAIMEDVALLELEITVKFLTIPLSLLLITSLVLQDVNAGESTQQTPSDSTPKQPGLVLQEFVFVEADFAQCHASTLAHTKNGLVAAWFGGTREGKSDVGIWFSRSVKDGWSVPIEVTNGVEDAKTRYPCWNPVLFQAPDGPLLLFYKVGPSPRAWWGMLTKSLDAGHSWSKPIRLPDGIAGPIKNKPTLLSNGELLCGSSTEDKGWRVHIERTTDWGTNWQRTKPLNQGIDFGAIQPTILKHGKNLQILCRSRGLGKIVESWSSDDGRSWSQLAATTLPNPNSGIDGVTLKDGQQLLVYNHTTRGRSPLNVAISADGKVWQAAFVLENTSGEYSYPAVIQSADTLVHISYTWRRQRIKHVVLDPKKLSLRKMPKGRWPQ